MATNNPTLPDDLATKVEGNQDQLVIQTAKGPVIIRVEEYKGVKRLDIRLFYIPNMEFPKTYAPTKQGVSIPLKDFNTQRLHDFLHKKGLDK